MPHHQQQQPFSNSRNQNYYQQPKPPFVETAVHPRTPLVDQASLSDSEKHERQRSAHRSRWHRAWAFTNRLWLWELLSLLLASVSLVAIVVTLRAFDTKEVPQWPASINLNTVIAVFAAILKAALMMPIGEAISQLKWLWYRQSKPLKDFEDFDRASRGPWGSLVLLGSLRGRDLATVGALLTLIALAIDPFAQQILHFVPCSVPVVGQALAPWSNNYTDGIGFTRVRIDQKMQGAMYLGLLGSHQKMSSLLEFKCPTGNCTFPETSGTSFRSLGMDNICMDISAQIQNANVTVENLDNTTSVVTTHILPSGLFLNDSSVFIYNSSTTRMIQDVNGTTGDPLAASYLHKFQILTFVGAHPAITHEPRAYECNVFPTIKSYSLSISNGQVSESVTAADPLQIFNLGTRSFGSTMLTSAFQNGSRLSCNSTASPTLNNTLPIRLISNTGSSGPLPPYPADMSSVANLTGLELLWYPRPCYFILDYRPSTAIASMLDYLFGNQTILFDPLARGVAGDQWTLNLWNNGTISAESLHERLSAMTDAMTAVLRMGDGSVSAGPAFGSVSSNRTCSRVRWGWIAFPSAMLVVTAVFLFATIVLSRWHGDNDVWKSSALAVLFHGLDEKTRGEFGPLLHVDEINEAAENLSVKMEGRSDGKKVLIGTT